MRSRLIRYGTGLVAAILIAAGVHLFCVGSYRISTQSMKNTLQKGDFVLVNKVKDTSNPGRERIVLFRSPPAQDRDSSPLFLGRCVGMPGDTVTIGDDGYRINGLLYPSRTTIENTFRIRKNIKEPLIGLLRDLEIPYRSVEEDSLNLTIRLTNREERLVRNKLPQLMQVELLPGGRIRHTFVIPAKNRLYRIDSTALFICREAILSEYGSRAHIRDGKLYIEGKETTFFFFHHDYYWMLSDNEAEAVDSRHLGLIPDVSVVGNVWFRWYGKDRKRLFKRIK